MEKKESVSSKFLKQFNNSNRSFLSEIEKMRKKHVIYCILIATILILILIFITIYLVKSNASNTDNLQWLFIFYICVPIIVFYISYHYKKEAKKRVMPYILSCLGDIKAVEPKISQDTDIGYIKRLIIFNKFNIYDCDDKFIGTYNNLDIEIMELNLRRETGSGKSRHVVTIFSGIFIKAPIIKKFSKFNRILIKSGGHSDSILNKEIHLIPNTRSAQNEVILEDVEFMNKFSVYSNNQIEARYILTPSFMTRLKELLNKDFVLGLKVSFEEGFINIAVSSNKDWFELPFLKPATDIRIYRQFLKEIETILSVIDILKLNQDIGL